MKLWTGRAANFPPLLVFLMLLSGCIVSDQSYFVEQSAVIPLRHGEYQVDENHGGVWSPGMTGSLTVAGRIYYWKGGWSELFGTLHDAGGGFFVAAMRKRNGPDDGYLYLLISSTADGLYTYEPDCQDLIKLRIMPDSLRPKAASKSCNFSDRAQLSQALIIYAKASAPSRRLQLKP